ncbi:putative exported protein [plant metagenome]|uniref:Putative exported protein n=1 Tax=plant metagenome TaxID=1297885 RepID=A0A484S5K3_9ZZZZ
MYTNLTKYPGLGFRHHIHGNRLHHCLILQATYALVRRAGRWVLEPLEEQPALSMTDLFRPVMAAAGSGKPGSDARALAQASSLQRESELLPFKPHADVLINGDAIAPDGLAAGNWLAGVRIGGWSKLLKVSGPRNWERDRHGKWRLSAPEAAERVPLLYEHAYGGTVASAQAGEVEACDENPCGIGYLGQTTPESSEAVLPVPAIEYPDDVTPAEPGRIQRVAGFGAIPMHWQPRARRLGTVDIDAIRRDGPAYPDDFDPAYWQTAPADQWLPYLARGQEVELFNLVEGEPKVAFDLPRWLGFAAVRSGGSNRYPDMRVDTLAIDTLARTVRLNWRLAVADEVDRPDWIGMELAIPEVLYPDGEPVSPEPKPETQSGRWRAAMARDQGEERGA